MSGVQKMVVGVIAFLLLALTGFSAIAWNSSQRDLDLTRNRLLDTQITVATRESELSAIQDQLSDIKDELKNSQAVLSGTQAELQSTNDYLLNIKTELEETKNKLDSVQADPFNLHNPTFAEAVEFLKEDITDQNDYIVGEYVCSHFVRDVNQAAESLGIRCAIVILNFPDQSHSIVGFNTVDEGMVYFDAITDEQAVPVIGKEYWRCIIPAPGHVYQGPDYADTIQDIVTIW